MSLLTSTKLEQKLKKGKKVIHKTLVDFPIDRTALAWTGGKDSTVLLWMLREVLSEHQLKMPHILFINEGDVFPEIVAFVNTWKTKWGFEIHTVQNDDVLKRVKKLGDIVTISELSRVNKRALKELGYDKKTFPFYPESLVGNHLMKTVPMQEYLKQNAIEALITGIRKDEQPARSKESYFSPRDNPTHMRVHPILDFLEKDIWDLIHKYKIPTVSLYKKGYRSLGAKSSTHRASKLPAWKQDFDKIPERAGRQQDKEKIMDKLRKLGYM